MDFTHLNLDYLNLMTDGDADMRLVMLSMLCEEIPTEMAKMQACFEKNDLDELKEVAHKMKSTLAFIGNDALTEANRAIEFIARGEGNPDELATHFSTLGEHLPGVLEELSVAAAG